MYLYRCDLTLHDYLFFATTERGKIAETGKFIHNYALTYAIGWARSEWRNETQQQHYAEQLGEVKNLYVTPAKLLAGSYALVQYNTLPETYQLTRIQSAGYPNWGYIKCFRPQSHFRFYILAKDALDKFPALVRLGKFMAKSTLTLQAAAKVDVRQGDYETRTLLNWDDITLKPTLCDVIVNALPSRLIENAHFANSLHITAQFADVGEISLPLEMGYLGRQTCNSW